MVKFFCLKAAVFFLLMAGAGQLGAQEPDFDFFNLGPSSEEPSDRRSDEQKSARELIGEAALLFQDERPLDARTKLLHALQKDPRQYHAHMMLAGYYMVHVGHFRLALRYVRQAITLFEEQHGAPPYRGYSQRYEHGRLLYLLSQARLNLDDYQGSLDALDEYAGFDYYDEWYPGSRAWVLMKLGRIDEAIKAARLGIFSGAEAGRTLNILGILLSMTGERQASIEVFKQAIGYEMSLGEAGQPATPLNNVGEVFRETFNEAKAESSWLKATSLRDGCEHVLPAINLALLNVDNLRFKLASRALNNFDGCIKQYPLRNGEEHRALLEMMRGRVALHTGHSAEALKLLKAALEHRQWFGKIGTSEADLQAAVLMSLAQALRVHNARLSLTPQTDLKGRLTRLGALAANSLESFWYLRRARQVMIEELRGLEDLHVRNTDSMIEYPTFGALLAALPTNLLEERIAREQERDNRKEALPYYNFYLAQNYLQHGRKAEASALLDKVAAALRPQYDDALTVEVALLRLKLMEPGSAPYNQLAAQVFGAKRAALLNNGLRLPVSVGNDAPAELKEILTESAFLVPDSGGLEYSLNYQYKNGQHSLEFRGGKGRGNLAVSSNDLTEALAGLQEKVFSEDQT